MRVGRLSAWIGPDNAQNLTGPLGTYDYQITFDLTGFNAATASISGQWTTDNQGRDILLNSVSTGNSIAFGSGPDNYSFNSWHPFTISGGFLPGLNTLDFLINNSSVDCGGDCSVNPTALRVEMTATASESSRATPLPAALPLFASGLGAMGFIGWRRKRKTAARAA
ncbi:MAG: PEP-CTERM sorting domain-containing protein [Pseudolabrys sp.]